MMNARAVRTQMPPESSPRIVCMASLFSGFSRCLSKICAPSSLSSWPCIEGAGMFRAGVDATKQGTACAYLQPAP